MGKKIGIDWSEWDNKLGKMADINIANIIGCHHSVVYRRRKKLGIKRFDGAYAKSKYNSPIKIQWDKARSMWGKHYDREIAAFLGCNKNTIYLYRRKHGIAGMPEGCPRKDKK